MRRSLPLALAMALLVVTLVPVNASLAQQSSRPRLSPRGTVDATIDGCAIGIEYGRPSRRERVIWGALVKWNAWWMPGADESTTITTACAMVLGEASKTVSMPAGAHTIYTLPAEETFTLILNNETGQFHTVYHPDRDLGRLPMTLTMLPEMTEQLTFVVAPREGGGGVLKLIWADREYAVPFVVKP
jgi:hypothetical protein